MEQGWVYVLVNSTMPGLAKVGRTVRSPAERAAELSAVTGVAAPFIVAFEQRFEDCHAAERAVHAELDRRGLRAAPNREFFRGGPSDIIRVVLETGLADGGTGRSPVARPPDLQAAVCLLDAGDSALCGRGPTLQDTGEAVRCYKLAVAAGSLEALERLGAVYTRLYAARRDRASRRRAMAPLKEGARRGNPYCYGAMASVFAVGGNGDNVAKAWALFFAGCAAMPEPAAQTARERARFAAACCRYLRQCLRLQVQPAHCVQMRASGDAILAALLAELDRAKADPDARRLAAGVLRLSHAVLLPPLESALVSASPAGAVPRRRWWHGLGGQAATA